MPKATFTDDDLVVSQSDAKVVCRECNQRQHHPRFDRCFNCANGIAPVKMVKCDICKKNEHPANYECCRICMRKRNRHL